MPGNKELRGWVILGVGLLGGILGWLIYDQLLWPTGGTPEEVVPPVQRHARLMRYFLVVFAGVMLSGMTRWVYWALCKALDTVKNEERALQQMVAQALLDVCTRRDAKYGVDTGRDACPAKERQRMTETNKPRDLLATLRGALQKLESNLEITRDGVDEIASQAERLRAGVEALGALRQREDTSVGIEMFVDAAVDLLEAFRALESGILDEQAEVDTLAAEMADDENGRDA